MLISLAVMLGVQSVSHAQGVGGMGGGAAGGLGTIPGTAFGGATDPSLLQFQEGFRVIPSIMVGERYDSNVFYAPKTPGLNREDFVTTTVPQLRGLYVGSLVSVNAMASAVGEYYAKNSALSYVGTNVGGIFDVSKLLSQLREGSRLTVSDTYNYTPQPPAFLTGDLSAEGTNPYVRGFQAGRANMQSNVFGANLSVPLSQTINVLGGYTNGFMKFGSSKVVQPGGLLDTTFSTYTTGLSMKVSPQDTWSLNFVNSEYSSGALGAFTTRGGTAGWTHLFTPSVSIVSAAGAQQVESKFRGAPTSTSIAPLANVALLWKDNTTTMTLAYSIGVTPSYQFQSQALLTHVASVSLTQQTAIPELLGIASLNYGRGDEFGSSSQAGASSLSYSAWGGTGGLTYRLTPKTFLGLTYSYTTNDQSFGGQTLRIDRQVVQMSLSQAFY